MNTEHQFTEAALRCLEQAGWNGKKRFTDEEIIGLFTDNANPVLEKAVSFLTVFNNLSLTFYNKLAGHYDDLNISIQLGNQLEVIEKSKFDYEPRIGARTCIIGTAMRDHFVLIMDENGAVYGGFDSFLTRIAYSGEQAIEAFVHQMNFTEIP
jgi:hypothetical protein